MTAYWATAKTSSLCLFLRITCYSCSNQTPFETLSNVFFCVDPSFDSTPVGQRWAQRTPTSSTTAEYFQHIRFLERTRHFLVALTFAEAQDLDQLAAVQ